MEELPADVINMEQLPADVINMEQLPADVIRLAYDYLDDHSLAQACMVNSNMAKNICNSKLWIPKIQNKFGFNKDEIDKYKGDNTYWGYYLNLSDIVDDKDPNSYLQIGLKKNRIDLVILAYNRGATDNHIYYPFENRNHPMLELVLTNNNDHSYKKLREFILGAIYYNDIIGLDMVLKDHKKIEIDELLIDRAIEFAQRNRNGTILYRLLQRSDNKFPRILLNLLKSGEQSVFIIKPFLVAGLNPNSLNGEIFYVAVQNITNPKILELFLEKGADVHLNNDAVLKYVSEWGRPETVKVFEKYLIEGGYSTKRLNLSPIQKTFQSLRDSGRDMLYGYNT